MTGYVIAVLGVLGFLVMTVLRGMVTDEIRDRLDHLPHAILRLAARRLDPGKRVTVYEAEWLPELDYILKRAEARPITRLIAGTKYAFGLLISVPRIVRHLDRKPSGTPTITSEAESAKASQDAAFSAASRAVERKFMVAIE